MQLISDYLFGTKVKYKKKKRRHLVEVFFLSVEQKKFYSKSSKKEIKYISNN